MSIISATLNGYVSKCIKAYAEKNIAAPDDVQLMFHLIKQESGAYTDGYKMCLHFKPKESYTIKQVLGIKNVDFKNFSNLLPPHITNLLIAQCKENSIGPDDIAVLATHSKGIITMHVYNGNDYVKTVKIDDLITFEPA